MQINRTDHFKSMQTHGKRGSRTTRPCQEHTEGVAGDRLSKRRRQWPIIIEAAGSSTEINHLRICLRQGFRRCGESTEKRSSRMSNCY